MADKPIFDFNTVQDFDNHISLSIPDYTGLVKVLTAMYLEYKLLGKIK
jgi:hypothetical protein